MYFSDGIQKALGIGLVVVALIGIGYLTQQREGDDNHSKKRGKGKRFSPPDLPSLEPGWKWFRSNSFGCACPMPVSWMEMETDKTFILAEKTEKVQKTALTVSFMNNGTPEEGFEFLNQFLNQFPEQLELENKIVLSEWNEKKEGNYILNTLVFADPVAAVRVVNTVILNNSTGSVFLIIFEALDSMWEDVWPTTGEYMLSRMIFGS